MYNRHIVGPNTLPWGTPLVMEQIWGQTNKDLTACVLLVRNAVIQSKRSPQIPELESLEISLG